MVSLLKNRVANLVIKLKLRVTMKREKINYNLILEDCSKLNTDGLSCNRSFIVPEICKCLYNPNFSRHNTSAGLTNSFQNFSYFVIIWCSCCTTYDVVIFFLLHVIKTLLDFSGLREDTTCQKTLSLFNVQGLSHA